MHVEVDVVDEEALTDGRVSVSKCIDIEPTGTESAHTDIRHLLDLIFHHRAIVLGYNFFLVGKDS